MPLTELEMMVALLEEFKEFGSNCVGLRKWWRVFFGFVKDKRG